MEFNYQQVITHSTTFHADDVFGVALCRLINPEIKVIRTLNVDKYLEMAANLHENALVFDIGMGKYDHHQKDKALRDDGTPYCGFGLLWRDFGHLLCSDQRAWEKVDQTLVIGIDKHDNGVASNLLSRSIGNMNPNWNDDTPEDIAFFRAMQVAYQLLKAQIDHANAVVDAGERVIASYTGGPILVLDKYVPWQDMVQTDERLKDILFCVYPSQRGGFCVQTVTTQPGSFKNRMDFPEEWLGHEDLARGITFAHTSNFLIVCEKKEQALRVAEEAIDYGRENEAKAVWSV